MPLHLVAGVEPVAGYMLVRLLGRGGFGEVWEAAAPGAVRVALKFIRLGTHEAGVEQRSLQVIRNITHPHLLDVQFATQVEDCLVIAMPLCGANLMDRLRACQDQGLPGLPRKELFRAMDDLARAVDYLNEPRHPAGDDGSLVGIQHRDIKPHNIFVAGDSVRLADFGLAKIVATSNSSHMVGTADYMSPEAIRGRVSNWSDQYSLAVTYVQLRTGRLPFDGDSVVHFIYAHLEAAPDLSGLPGEERPVLARALAKLPEERWPNCRGFVRALILAARTRTEVVADVSVNVNADLDVSVRPGAEPRAKPMAEGETKLPETRGLTPVPLTRVDDGSLSGEKAAAKRLRPWSRPLRLRLRHAGLAGLAAVLAGLATVLVLVLPRREATTPNIPEKNPPVVVAERAGHQAVPPVSPVEDKAPKVTTPDLAVRTPAPTPQPTVPEEPRETITSSLGMKLVLIPAGEFAMGSPDADEEADAGEKPQHQVRIARPFYLGMYEVTQEEYETVMVKNPSWFSAQGGGKDRVASQDARRYPAETVSWNEAILFCNTLSRRDGLKPYYDQIGVGSPSGGDGYRLPTEAEWEYACRAGSTTRYSFGDDAARLDEHTWSADNSDARTHPVGQKRPNAFGLYDMHGNVWEWCWDGYDPRSYANSPGTGPSGPSGTSDRVIRGGCYNSLPRNLRSSYRSRNAPENGSSSLGFRLARDQPVTVAKPPDVIPAELAKAPQEIITNTLGMKLALIPAGTFEMGSSDSDKVAESDEKPQHRVQITRRFYLGIHEVTQGQYRAVTGLNPSYFKGSDDLPVEQVSWNDAIAFCNKLSEREHLKPYYASGKVARTDGEGYRLPTEAEWEYACRAGSQARYGFGDDEGRLGEFAWVDSNSGGKTHPVGQKRPNAFGLYDMHGNVWEWCWDWYESRYYDHSAVDDPSGPSQASDRVDRGGSWFYEPRYARSAIRLGGTPGIRSYSLGFRVARVQAGP